MLGYELIEAQAPAERFTRYSGLSICGLAALPLLWNLPRVWPSAAALERAVAVLVIACPRARGMPVPSRPGRIEARCSDEGLTGAFHQGQGHALSTGRI